MNYALEEAKIAAARGEVPVGAVVVSDAGEVIAQASNRTRELNDPSAHAEMLAIRAASARLGQERLEGYDLYVTLEPCAMCAGVISAARIRRLYYGASIQNLEGWSKDPVFFSILKATIYLRFGRHRRAGSQLLLKAFFKH